jgi:hypothetical protein
MDKMINEYIENTRMSTDFSQHYLRDRIRDHKALTRQLGCPEEFKCTVSLSALTDHELIAYDEYLNCVINSVLFRRCLENSNRFTNVEVNRDDHR